MKKVALIHNPMAGEGDKTMSTIISTLKAEGYDCGYSSTKEQRSGFGVEEADFIAVAGGDGTIRQVALENLERHVPIAVLPIGTANNIANALGVSGSCENVINDWKHAALKGYDIGCIRNHSEHFFLEGVGFGVFPSLMKIMQEKNDVEGQEKMRTALEWLYEIVEHFTAVPCAIELNGNKYFGKYLLAEVMNIPSIGPNLDLVPYADPSDGHLDVVLISEDQRGAFLKFIESKLASTGTDQGIYSFFHTLRARQIMISWEGQQFHVDDSIERLESEAALDISTIPDGLSFMVPNREKKPR